MKTAHKKHAQLSRPSYGRFAKNEWAVYGTTCGDVKDLYEQIEVRLANRISCAYIDADHHHDEGNDLLIKSGKQQLHLRPNVPLNEYDLKDQLTQFNLAIVNGNHYPAQRQILVINADKKESLRRRADQIEHIDLIIRRNEGERVFSFIREILKTHKDKVPVFQWNQKDEIADYLYQLLVDRQPGLKAVILGGGKSQRMGRDKSQIDYHGKPQEIYMAGLCSEVGIDVYLSKKDESQNKQETYPVIYDKFPGMGPFGAICSAFMTDPDSAWLVLACDLPFFGKQQIQDLIDNRDPFKVATCLKGSSKQFPEPLVTIWEPKSYHRLLSFLSKGYSCPRKVLINSDCNVIDVQDEQIITNVNTKEEYEQFKRI